METAQQQRNDRDEKGRFIKGNRKRFADGESGNPGGRPKGLSLTAAVNRLLRLSPERGLKLKPKKGVDVLAQGIFIAATKGDSSLAREIWNRIDGKVPERVEHSGPGGEAIDMRLRQLSDEELLGLLAMAKKMLAETESEERQS